MQTFEDKVVELIPHLRSHARKLERCAYKCDDLVSETILKAFENQTKFKDGNLRAWLITILRNNFTNRYRRMRLGVVVFNNEAIDTRSTNSAEVDMQFKQITKAMDEHPEGESIRMFMEGFKYEEIAEKLKLPIGTVKSKIYRVRQVLLKL